ncbi:uncharacterized protein IWZ02DRAFT_10126 [Phyllosticta citriasiana]|uniref:uncharacterized protein n=1 Tax=Phyllosticta citriasiana TaxID=595635 RepID=UPI0030FD5EA5
MHATESLFASDNIVGMEPSWSSHHKFASSPRTSKLYKIPEHMPRWTQGVEREDFFGITPLMYAAAYGEASSVGLLLRHGADPFRSHKSTYYDHDLQDQLFVCWTKIAMSRSTEFFAQLFSWYTPRASYGKIKYVIDRSIKVYPRKYIRYRDCTPRKNDLEMLRYVVDHGADMGQIDEHHNTLLHQNVLPEEAMILLNATRYSINHKNDFGWTPMMVLITVAASDAPTMLKTVREANSKGATIGSFENRGKTALHHLLDLLNGTINIKTDSEYQKLGRTFTNPIVARTAILKAALLVQLGAEISQGDACSCHCCHNGCSIFRRFLYRSKPWDCRLKMCRSFTEEMHSLIAMVG